MHTEFWVWKIMSNIIKPPEAIGCNLLGWNMPIDNAPENSRHSVIIKLIDGDRVEMAKEARCDGIATATWWQPREQHMHAWTGKNSEHHGHISNVTSEKWIFKQNCEQINSENKQ